MPHIRRFLCSTLLLGVFAAQGIAGDPPVDPEACSSTATAQSLVSCDHCHDLKEALGEVEGRKLRIDVYDLSQGVLIQLVGLQPEDTTVLGRVAGQIWGLNDEGGSAEAADFCDVCLLRSRKLQRCDRDRALTADGAIVVLTSPDRDIVAWLREDARTQQRLLHRAVASN